VAEAADALTAWRPHLVFLDVDVAGSAILERLRPAQVNCPAPPAGAGAFCFVGTISIERAGHDDND